jgi:hypothetical protein
LSSLHPEIEMAVNWKQGFFRLWDVAQDFADRGGRP